MRWLGPLVVAAVCAIAAPAAADVTPEARAAATALFDDGRKLMQAGDYAAACPKLEEAARLDAGIGTVYNLGDCYEHLGKTASAWSSFRQAAGLAAAKNQPDREKAARGRADALEPKLARLKITAPSPPPPGLTITQDDKPVGSALWGSAVPVDPGRHTIVASAPGKVDYQTVATLDQPGATVSIDVPALADAPAAAAVPAGVGKAASPKSDAPAASASTWMKPLGITLAAAGVVGLGVGTALGFVAKSNYDGATSNAACSSSGSCTSAGISTRDDARSLGTVATIVFISGAVIGAGGAVLWIAAPSAKKSDAASALAVGVGPGSITARASF